MLYSNLKKIFCFGVLVISISYLQAQGLINNGANIHITSNTNIWINTNSAGNFTNQNSGAFIGTVTSDGNIYVHGDWINNASSNVFTSNGGYVYLNGPAQQIGGGTPTFFYRLITGGTGAKTLSVNTTVGGGFPSPTGGMTIVQPVILNSNILSITNPNAGLATIDDSGGGYIISETNAASNPSIVQWNMGATNGNYKFPFGDVGGTLIPFYLNKTGGTGNVAVATRPTNTIVRDNQPWQTGVSNMFSPMVAGPGEVPVVVDRWWDINVSGSATAALTFTYIGSENTLNAAYQAGPLGAQTWYGSGWAPPTGTGPGVTIGTAQVVTPAQPITSRPWVISSIAAPLPVEMLLFEVTCKNKKAILKWSTASEIENDYFLIERSTDAVHFESIKQIPGAGTSNSIHSYSYTDEHPLQGVSFYKIRQIDFNGNTTATHPVTFDGCSHDNFFEAYLANLTPYNPVLVINSSISGNFFLEVFDAAGKRIINKSMQVIAGTTTVNFLHYNLSSGVYLLKVSGSNYHQNYKMIIAK